MPVTRAGWRTAAGVCIALFSMLGCDVNPNISDLTGRWTLNGGAQTAAATLRLQPDGTFTAAALPCAMVPFGCPNDSSTGPSIDGSGTWHLLQGHPRSLQAESNPYTQVVLIFQQMGQGSHLLPKTAQTSLIVQHSKTFELYSWQSGEIDPANQWTHLQQTP